VHIEPLKHPGFALWHRVCTTSLQWQVKPCTAEKTRTKRVDTSEANSTNSTTSTKLTLLSKFLAEKPKVSSPDKYQKVEIKMWNANVEKFIRSHSRHMKKQEDQLLKKHGFRWAVEPKRWTKDAEVWKKEVNGNVRCAAAFIAGVSVCDTGARVSVQCDMGWNGFPIEIPVGCGCSGTLLQAKVLGLMSNNIPSDDTALCADTMEEWSLQAESAFYTIGPAQTCAAEALQQCSRQMKDDRYVGLLYKQRLRTVEQSMMHNLNGTAMMLKKKNAKIQKEEDTLQKQILHPMWEYREIPGFGLPNQKAEKTAGSVECRKECNVRGQECKGYSFDSERSECSWTTTGISYDDNFVLYIKSRHPDEGSSFNTIPGMKLVADNQDEKESSLAECKGNCLVSDTCFSISYSEDRRFCVISQAEVQEGSSWSYFEKKGWKEAQRKIDTQDEKNELASKQVAAEQARFHSSFSTQSAEMATLQDKLDNLAGRWEDPKPEGDSLRLTF